MLHLFKIFLQLFFLTFFLIFSQFVSTFFKLFSSFFQTFFHLLKKNCNFFQFFSLTFFLHPKGATIGTCDIWDTDYNTDNWEPGLMTIFVTWQLIVTLDSIPNDSQFLRCFVLWMAILVINLVILDICSYLFILGHICSYLIGCMCVCVGGVIGCFIQFAKFFL